MRFSTLRPYARVLALALVCGFSTQPAAHAAPPPAATAALHIEVAVVRAGHGARSVDPALAAFAADLRSLPYETFSRVDGRSVSTTPGARQEINLSSGLRAVITVDSADDAGAATSIALFRDGREVTHTTVKRPWGRAQVISVGKLGDDMLVVPVAITR